MFVNQLYQSNYYYILLKHDSEQFVGKTKNGLVTLTIDSFQNIISINSSVIENYYIIKKDFLILEALDDAKLNLYKIIVSQIDAEQVRNNLQFKIEELQNRTKTYIERLVNEEKYFGIKDLEINLNQWHDLYNSKFEYIDIIEFVFYINNMTKERLIWCLQNYENKPEIIFD